VTEFRVDPAGSRIGMRVPVDDDMRWLALGWVEEAGVTVWRLTDDDVADWVEVPIP
jgi:hypothetical protein